MKHQRHFERKSPCREALQTRILIADIGRVVQILNSDIAAEEEQAGIYQRSEPEYPSIARTLVARRDNLNGTIAALEKRLSDLPADTRKLKIDRPHEPSSPSPFLIVNDS
jgi:hypothetical protein